MPVTVPVILGQILYTGTLKAQAGVLVDNTFSYDFKDAGGSTVNGLELDSSDDLFIGDTTGVDDINYSSSTGVHNFIAGAAVDNIVEIQAATGRKSEFLMAGDDINLPMTTLFPADVYAQLRSISGTEGGLFINAMSENGARPLVIRGNFGVTNPPDATPAVQIRGSKSDGSTGITSLAATETVFQITNFDESVDHLTIVGSGGQVLTNTDTTGNAWTLTANVLTTGNMLIGANTIGANGLTNRSAGNNLIDFSVSRTDSRTTGTTVDDFDLMSLSRTQVTTGGGGALTAAGSVLKLENISTQSAGTLTDTVNVLEIVQNANSPSLYIDSEATSVTAVTIDVKTTEDIGFIDFVGTSAGNATNAISSFTAGNSIQGFVQIEVNGTSRWMPFYDDPAS